MNPEDRLVSYEYDDRSLRTKLTYPDNSYITYEYDALSRLTQIGDDSNSVLAAYEYDELSRRALVTLGNDANAVYEYDLGETRERHSITFGPAPVALTRSNRLQCPQTSVRPALSQHTDYN